MSKQNEEDRIKFMLERDGAEAAMDFIKRTYATYRKALMQSRKRGYTKPHHASLPEYRCSFIESCVVFRKYIHQQKGPL